MILCTGRLKVTYIKFASVSKNTFYKTTNNYRNWFSVYVYSHVIRNTKTKAKKINKKYDNNTKWYQYGVSCRYGRQRNQITCESSSTLCL